MITKSVAFVLIILVNLTPTESAVLPQWVHRVPSCPDPGNVSLWMEASRKLNCQNQLSSNDPKQQGHQYHCLPSSFLNETVQFCGRSAPIGPGACAVYSYEFSANIQPTSYNCSKFTSGCPEELFHSKNIFRYPECLNISKSEKCFKAEKNCSNSFNNAVITTDITSSNERFEHFTSVILTSFAILEAALLICILVWLARRRGIRLCNCQDGGKNLSTKHMLHQAMIYTTNGFIDNLSKAMRDEEFNAIKYRLEGLPGKDPFNVKKISTRLELLRFIDKKYSIKHNMCFVQGIFENCNASHLSDVCVEYMTSMKNEGVTFFERQTVGTDYNKVKYVINYPAESKFTNEDLNNLREMLRVLTNAQWEDILVHKVKKGSIIVTFEVKKRISTTLLSIYTAEKKCNTQQKILESIKHQIMRIEIDGKTIYTSDMSASGRTDISDTDMKEQPEVNAEKEKDQNENNPNINAQQPQQSGNESNRKDTGSRVQHCLCKSCVDENGFQTIPSDQNNDKEQKPVCAKSLNKHAEDSVETVPLLNDKNVDE